jgi:adenylate cyclase
LRASGLVDGAGLDRARQYARENGSLLSDALLRMNLVKEQDFLRVFAELYSTRFVKAEKLRTLKLDEALLERVGVRSAERLRMCPIRWDPANAELHVVAGAPLSSNLEPELRQLLGARVVTVYVATAGAVSALIRKAFYRQDDAFAQVTANGAGPGLPQITGKVEMPDDEQPQERTTISRMDERDTASVDLAPSLMISSPLPGPSPARPSSPAPTRLSAAPLSTNVSPVSPFAPSVISQLSGTSSTDTIVPAPRSEGKTEGKTVMVNLEALTIATLRRENARYRVAQEFHRRVTLERSVETMVDRILSVIFELVAADGAAVWMSSGQYASKSKDGARKIEVPRAVIEQALASTSGGVLTHNALLDERFDRSQSVMIRGVKSVMAVPMRTASQTIGILYVESVSMSAAFTDDDLPLLDSIAAQAAILLDNAALVAQVQKEMETRIGLSRFLSQAAVDEVLSGRMKVKLEGGASDITVLFADIRGFTTLSAHMRPEEVVRFLNTFFGEAVDAVEKYGGIVDKFIGDCVMALWGAVSPREDDARMAIKAALEMVERASTIRVNGSPLQVGVGINTGSAVVGAIGGKKRSDYTAIGATVNLAARLCGIADAGSVLITADTLMRAGPGVMNEANESVILKGLDTPMVPYRVRAIMQPLQLNRVTTNPKIPRP